MGKAFQEVERRRRSRIELTPLTKDYLPLISKWLIEPVNASYFQSGTVISGKKISESFDHVLKTITRWHYFIITADTVPIGLVGLIRYIPQNDTPNQGEINIVIGEKSYKRRGFASEALRKIIQYSRDVHDLSQLNAYINTGNSPSIKLFTRAGFTPTDNYRLNGVERKFVLVIRP